MTKHFGVACIALLLLCTLPVVAQKKLPPPAIRFQGASQYTDQELFAASGLKSDQRLSAAEVKARAKQLNDTGLFKEVKFVSTTKTLTFTLTPLSQLYPMHLDNVPLASGKELEAKLHERFPLYHGQLPGSGSMVDGICRTFEEMLAAKGIKATVKAALTSGLGPQKLTAVNFTVVTPAVHIGRIQLAGVSAAMQAKANLLAVGQSGNSFDTENSGVGIEHVFEDFYQDQGYAAVEVSVAQLDPLLASNPDQSIEIPFTVTVKEGAVYKVGTIDYPADTLVARADVEKILQKYPSGARRPLDLYRMAVCDAYHAKGYLDCSVVSHPSFNEATRIVNYSLEITPGTQYQLASVKFDSAPAAMGAKLKLAWKMAPGDAFDQSYLDNFAALAQKKDKQLVKWLQTVVTTYDVATDPATHKVTCIFHFAAGAQSPR
jgi:outer membrane protein insertion porin family